MRHKNFKRSDVSELSVYISFVILCYGKSLSELFLSIQSNYFKDTENGILIQFIPELLPSPE